MSPPPAEEDLYGDEEFDDFQDDFESETGDELTSVADVNATWPDPFDEGTESSSPPGEAADSQSVASGGGPAAAKRSPRRGQGAAASNGSTSGASAASRGLCAKRAPSARQEGFPNSSDCQNGISETAAALRIQSAHRGREARREARTRRSERDQRGMVTNSLSPIQAESDEKSSPFREAESPLYVESEESGQAAVQEMLTAESVLARRCSTFSDAQESGTAAPVRRPSVPDDLIVTANERGIFFELAESRSHSRVSMLTPDCADISPLTVSAKSTMSVAQEFVYISSDSRQHLGECMRKCPEDFWERLHMQFQCERSSASSAPQQRQVARQEELVDQTPLRDKSSRVQVDHDADTVASTSFTEKQGDVTVPEISTCSMARQSSSRGSVHNHEVQCLIGNVMNALDTYESDDSASEAEDLNWAPMPAEPPAPTPKLCAAPSASSSEVPLPSLSTAVNAPCSEPQPPSPPNCAVRVKAGSALLQALSSGKLDEELSAARLRMLKERAAQTFVNASKTGTLKSAFVVLSASHRSMENAVEARLEAEALTASWRGFSRMLALANESDCTVEARARDKAFQALVGASQRGELERAIRGTELPLQQRARTCPSAVSIDKNTSEVMLRRRLFDAFATADLTGSLSRALTAPSPSLREKADEVLRSGAETHGNSEINIWSCRALSTTPSVAAPEENQSASAEDTSSFPQGVETGLLEDAVLNEPSEERSTAQGIPVEDLEREPLSVSEPCCEDTFEAALRQTVDSASSEVFNAVRLAATEKTFMQGRAQSSSSSPARESHQSCRLDELRRRVAEDLAAATRTGEVQTAVEVAQSATELAESPRCTTGDFRCCPADAWASMHRQFPASQCQRERPDHLLDVPPESNAVEGDFRRCPASAWASLHALFEALPRRERSATSAKAVPSFLGDFRKCPPSAWAALHANFANRSGSSSDRELPSRLPPPLTTPSNVGKVTSCTEIDDEAVAAACRAGAAVGIGDLLADLEADLFQTDADDSRDCVTDGAEEYAEDSGFFISAGGALAPSFADGEEEDLLWAGRGDGQSAVLQAYVAATGALVAPDPAKEAEAAIRIQAVFRGFESRRRQSREIEMNEVGCSWQVNVACEQEADDGVKSATVDGQHPPAVLGATVGSSTLAEEEITLERSQLPAESQLRLQLEAKQVVMRVTLKVVCALQEMQTRRLLKAAGQARALPVGANTARQEPPAVGLQTPDEAARQDEASPHQPARSAADNATAAQEAAREQEPSPTPSPASPAAAASLLTPSAPRSARPLSGSRPAGRVVASRPASGRPPGSVTKVGVKKVPSSAPRSPSAPKRTSVHRSPSSTRASVSRRHGSIAAGEPAPAARTPREAGEADAAHSQAEKAAGRAEPHKAATEKHQESLPGQRLQGGDVKRQSLSSAGAKRKSTSSPGADSKHGSMSSQRKEGKGQSTSAHDTETRRQSNNTRRQSHKNMSTSGGNDSAVSDAAPGEQSAEALADKAATGEKSATFDSDLQQTGEADADAANQDYYEVSEEEFDRLMQAGCLQPGPPEPVRTAEEGTYVCDVSDAEFQLLLDAGVLEHVDFAYPTTTSLPMNYRSYAAPQQDIYSYGFHQGYEYAGNTVAPVYAAPVAVQQLPSHYEDGSGNQGAEEYSTEQDAYQSSSSYFSGYASNHSNPYTGSTYPGASQGAPGSTFGSARFGSNGVEGSNIGEETPAESPTSQNSKFSSNNMSPNETPRGEKHMATRSLPGGAASASRPASGKDLPLANRPAVGAPANAKTRGSMLFHFPNTASTAVDLIVGKSEKSEISRQRGTTPTEMEIPPGGRMVERRRSSEPSDAASGMRAEAAAEDADVAVDEALEAVNSDTPRGSTKRKSSGHAPPLLPPLDVNAGRHRDPMAAIITGGGAAGARSARSHRPDRGDGAVGRRGGRNTQRSNQVGVPRGRSFSPNRRQVPGGQILHVRSPQPPPGPPKFASALRPPQMSGPPPPNGLSPRPPALGGPKVNPARAKQAMRYIGSGDVAKSVGAPGSKLPGLLMPAMAADLDAFAKPSGSPKGSKSSRRGRHPTGQKGTSPTR